MEGLRRVVFIDESRFFCELIAVELPERKPETDFLGVSFSNKVSLYNRRCFLFHNFAVKCSNKLF